MTTRLVDNRDAALKVGYAATDWTQPVDYTTYETALQDWNVKAIERDGQYIGAAFFRGDELHTSILPDWRRRWATKGLLKELFAAERVTTRVTPGHEYMHDILHRLGFTQTDDGLFVKEH